MDQPAPTGKTILFHPLNSPGHINPMVALADILRDEYQYKCVFLVLGKMIAGTLAEHGHEVIQLQELDMAEFYEIKDFEDPLKNDLDAEKRGEKKIKVSGCEIWSHLIVRNSGMFKLAPMEAYLQTVGLIEQSMVKLIQDNHDQMEQAIYERVKPDLIVIDSYIIPPCVIKRQRSTPWVRIFSANPMPLTRSRLANGLKPTPMFGFSLKTKQERELMRREQPDRWQAMLDEWARVQGAIGEAMKQKIAAQGSPFMDLLSSLECPPPAPGTLTHDSEYLNLHTFPKRLDYDQDDDIFEYGPREFRVDSMIRLPFGRNIAKTSRQEWEGKLEEAKSRFPKGVPVIYLSLGTIASGNVSLMKRVISIVARDKGRLYVVSKGVNGQHYELAENMIGANYLPQTFFLDNCQLAIVHGGNNTINECCFYGKPMIVMPVFFDQMDNAQRVEDLGLGRRLGLWDEAQLESQLVAAIDSLLSDQKCLEKCAMIGQEMRARDEPHKAAFMVDTLIRNDGLSQEFIELCRNLDLPEIKEATRL